MSSFVCTAWRRLWESESESESSPIVHISPISTSSSTAASTSASANSTSNSPFDVFINHRGPDVKKTFASYLYRRLCYHGLKVFLDQEELQRGANLTPQIEGAIQTASVHVAILSKTYAESTWCLDELLKMSESKGTTIPVFYHVKPSDLRYGKALSELEKKTNADKVTLRHDPTTVQKWRKALSDVSHTSGFELEACNGDEGVLLEKVVASVLRKVKKTLLDVAKYPTGLDKKVRDFENKILRQHQQHSGIKAQVVGIVGFGGVGKTTLAKELFNLKSSDYNRSCFLDDVRENVKKGSLISLQSNLLRRLTGSGSDLLISNKHEGTEMLRKHLSSQQILLILDDVDSVDQVDALLPNEHFIHSNSLILITSRDRDILTRSGVENESIYKLDGLGQQHSLKLFCRHAFNQPYPLSGFEILTRDFLKVCDGLPLSLKVIGALLGGNNDVYYWQSQLYRLKKILPNEIQERLKFSYDALNDEEKQIFLDIACFFRGHDPDMAIRIWEASGWQGRFGFENLRKKCLVEVVEEVVWNPYEYGSASKRSGKIHMHDHLRDLGRSESLVRPPLRFWHIDQLLGQSSVITVRGIRMVLSEDHDDDVFEGIQMSRLQLVDTEGSLLDPVLKRLKLPNLIWLRWMKCPYSSLPGWIPMKNLTVLQVSGNTLETLWELESQAPLQLPVRLEELRVDGCEQLKSIWGLALLTKLRLIDVRWCSKLEELPCMGTWASLEELRARGCERLKSIRGLEQATKLRVIDVRQCSELEELPCMETWASLEELRAEGCARLKSIRGLEQATKLRLMSVPGCSELEELPCMETWASLEELRAYGCARLKSIRGLEQATKLRLIDVHCCSKLEELPCMETGASLEELWAYKCARLKSIWGLEQATKLRAIDVAGCFELEELPCMETWASLEELWAQGCARLKSIRGLEQATKLRLMYVGGCSELEELPCMETWASLEELRAEGCARLKSIRGLEQATKLRLIDVDGCSELEELPCMETWASLEVLSAYRCGRLKSIRGLEQATKLRLINVDSCYELEELPCMETWASLEELRAEGCARLKSIRGLEQATKLRLIDVDGCSELQELPCMETWASLEELWAKGCARLKSIRGLEQATKLRLIDVGGCSELEELPCMETWESLKGLWAERCTKLKSIRGLLQCRELRTLSVKWCCELEEVEGVEHCTWLEELDVYGCHKLQCTV